MTANYQKQLQKIDAMLHKVGTKKQPMDTQVRIYSRRHGIDYRYESNGPRPYHVASIGKVFVVALLLQMVGENKLQLDQKIHELLPSEVTEDLFVVGGEGYSSSVTIRHLATHTSGVNDYFEGKSSSRSSFVSQIITDPNHTWSPDELLDYTRMYQQPVGRPGERFLYSDTGYILLGKILEKVSGMSYAKLLCERIFSPFGMSSSYLYDTSERGSMAPLYIKGVDISMSNSLSCDWSGGGVVATVDDLLLFQTALHQGVFGDMRAEQAGYPHAFRSGMHYGFGMMELHFSELFFLLRGMPTMTGHIGVTATHMFYDSVNDVHYIMNFGSDKRMVESFRTLIKITQTLHMKG